MLELKGRQQQETEGGLLFASRRTEVCARSQLEGPYVGDSLCVCCAGLWELPCGMPLGWTGHGLPVGAGAPRVQKGRSSLESVSELIRKI